MGNAHEGVMGSRQKLLHLLTELATLRDRARRVCQETEALRKTYLLAIERTHWMRRPNEALSPERDTHTHRARAKTNSDWH